MSPTVDSDFDCFNDSTVEHLRLHAALATTTGRTYERAMIVRWLETHGSDPTDPSSVLNIKDLVPNRAVRAMIEEFARTAEM